MGGRLSIITLLFMGLSALPAGIYAKGLDPDKKIEPAWLIVKGGGQLLEIAQNNVVKLDGAGKLKFKREGRFIEVPKGFTVMVNGLPVSKERAIHKGELVQIVNGNSDPVWELDLGSEKAAPSNPDGWAEISIGNAEGEFTLSHDRPMTTLLRPGTGGMLRMRSFPSLFADDFYED